MLMHIHTVSAGESLHDIAKKYGIPATKIIENNTLDCPDRLSVGQKLLILTPTRTYRVRGGDTIDSIAERFSVGRGALIRANPALSAKRAPRPEQVVAIKYDTPPHGSALFNGYYYKGCPEERLKLALAHSSFVTISSHRLKWGVLEEVFDTKEVLLRVRDAGRAPLLRIYSPDAYEVMSGCRERIIEGIVQRAKGDGYRGVTLAMSMAEQSPDFGEMVLELRRALMAEDLLTVIETDGTNPRLCDLGDLIVQRYEKCHLNEIPSFEEGERRHYHTYATECDSTKTFIDLSPFAYSGSDAMTHAEANALAYRQGQEIVYDGERMICSFEYGRRGRRQCVKYEALENIKAKLALVSELGFAGISFDIMRVPTEHLLLASATFARAGYAEI